jgi:hypothetical protein
MGYHGRLDRKLGSREADHFAHVIFGMFFNAKKSLGDDHELTPPILV